MPARNVSSTTARTGSPCAAKIATWRAADRSGFHHGNASHVARGIDGGDGPPSEAACGNTTNDPQNCGRCGHVCPTGAIRAMVGGNALVKAIGPQLAMLRREVRPVRRVTTGEHDAGGPPGQTAGQAVHVTGERRADADAVPAARRQRFVAPWS